MGKSLKGIAQELKNDNKRVQLIYAFNGTGTQDLFYWYNDLVNDIEPKLIIQPNAFTKWNKVFT